ncbi:MAG: hypothetical protein JRI67_09735 [Deltaproteobacteria bacterium]|nr:hypothetical protein [Deltaproteobacteria bacterium]
MKSRPASVMTKPVAILTRSLIAGKTNKKVESAKDYMIVKSEAQFKY